MSPHNLMGGTLKNESTKIEPCLRRDKVGPEPSSASLFFSVQAVKAVMILCECVGSTGHSLLVYGIIQNSHELALQVLPEPSSTYFFGV